jgi:hypothetical protein
MITKCRELSDEEIIATIKKSIESGYNGLYPVPLQSLGGTPKPSGGGRRYGDDQRPKKEKVYYGPEDVL